MPTRRLTLLAVSAALLLVVLVFASTWVTVTILNPARTADTTASGTNTLAAPITTFKSASVSIARGTTGTLAIQVDSNGGSLRAVSTTVLYDPKVLRVDTIPSQPSVCNSITKTNDAVRGMLTISCTAPSGGSMSQVATLTALAITPLTSGVFTLSIDGKHSDFAVVSVP